jgi:hypothetical protein
LDAQRRYESIAAGPCGSPRAPLHIVRALRRGLSLEPGARFSDMDELLAALTQPARSRGFWASRSRASRSHGRARGLRSTLSFAALASVFVLSLIASREAPADAGIPITVLVADAGMENVRDLAFDGNHQLAISTLMDVLPIVRQTDPAYQSEYLAQLEALGDVLSESGAYNQAAMAYAAGKNLARDLDVDPSAFVSKRTAVQAKANRKTRSAAAESPDSPTRGK